jgi:serine protease Do
VRTAWIGLEVRDLTDRGYAALLGREGTQDTGGAVSVAAPGVQARRVYPGSPAEKSGLEAGDLITKIGSEPITSRTDFETVMSRFKSGDSIPLTWRKAGSERKADVPAADFPTDLSEDWLADQIGLELADISPDLRRQWGGLPPDGVVVTRVRNRSHAYFSGFEEGDILRGIYDLPVRDMSGLKKAVPRIVGRDAVLLKVVRGRYQYLVTIDLT